MTETRPLCPKCMKPFALTEMEGHIGECRGMPIRRQGRLGVTLALLKETLYLPKDCRITGIVPGWVWGDNGEVTLYLEGEGLPEVREGYLIPEVDVVVRTDMGHFPKTRFEKFTERPA